MPERNVEVVRSMWEPFKGIDATTIDWEDEAVREIIGQPFSPDVVLTWSARWAGKREYRGRDGVIQAYKEWVDPFSEYFTEPLDFIEVGDEFVVVPTRQWGVGEASRVPVETEVTHVFEFREGQIVRLDEYETVEEGLEAAGRGE
jgi:ketosteroid isomerase-like protein